MTNRNRSIHSVVFTTLILVGLMTGAALAAKPKSIDLLKGAKLTAFEEVGDANWSMEKDAVVADAGKGFLVTKKPYTDFHLKLEFFAGAGTNSGVFFRCADATTINDQICYEANIFDTRPDPTYRTGAITTIAAPKVTLNTEDGSWHTYEIQAVGSEIKLILDGQETVATKDAKHATGRIALQLAGGAIKFRNIKLTSPVGPNGVR